MAVQQPQTRPAPQARPAPPVRPGQPPPQARQGAPQPRTQQPAPVQAPPFNLKTMNWKLYGQAWSNFVTDFFPKKVPYFFQNIQKLAPTIPDWFKKLVQDEQIAYGVVIGGFVLLFVGIIVAVLL